MSNGTKIRGVRVPEDLWRAAKTRAAKDGLRVSDVVRDALTNYTREAATP